ncbi:MAG: hypothetical protein AAGF93_01530 [Cyanobacteria bacterium P01_H01_bin.105]
MIIKSSQRAGHTELAAHLMKRRDIDGTPQTVTISGSRDLVNGDDVHQALGDMAILAMASNRCQKDLYHISLSPAHPMTADDWETVWQLYEDEFGLSHLPYIEVTHTKGDNRPPHRHRVYERVDIESCKAVQLSHTRIRNELVARKIEFTLGHPLTIGKHNRTVIKRLEQDGEPEMIAWMQHAHDCDRPAANQNHADTQMEKRTKLSTEQVKADLQVCYTQTDNGQSFRAAIAAKGYQLARGDRRDFVIVDAMGGIHSPRRRLAVKAKELRQRWADLEQSSLAHVDDIVRQVKARLKDALEGDNSNQSGTDTETVTTNNAASNIAGQGGNDSHSGGRDNVDSLPELHQKAADLAAEIETFEATIAADDSKQIDDEVLNYWQRQGAAEPERSRPRSRVSNQHGRGRQSKPKLMGISDEGELLQLQGQGAIAERQHRLLALFQPMPGQALSNQPASNHVTRTLSEAQSLQQGMVDYQRLWQERFRGQTTQQLSSRQAYRLGADRWILQRLVRRGYSRSQARSILMRSSPELLNQRPRERLSYIRRMVNQVYTPYEQQQQLTAFKVNVKQKIPDAQSNTREVASPDRSKRPMEKTSLEEHHPKTKSNKSIDRSPDRGLER